MSEDITLDSRRQFAEVFSGFRAEWLGSEVFDLFTEPSYFPQLTTSHPCILVGGRGTGKTTALRCLSYQGQAALDGRETRSETASWPFVGMYHRINTNRVRAFSGPELDEGVWLKLFAHYINIAFSELVLQFLVWHSARHPEAEQLHSDRLGQFAAALHLPGTSTIADTARELELSRVRFEAMINNVADSAVPPLSLQGAPIDILLGAVKQLPQFDRTSFFFLLDEYENFDSSQQRVVNTLIKHCGDLYSFKVSVREFGFTQRSTLNEHEQLVHPADYRLIDITSELRDRFPRFAAEVCGRRITAAFDTPGSDIGILFPELPAEEEARVLGVSPIVEPWINDLKQSNTLTTGARRWLDSADPLESYTLFLRSRAERMTPEEKLTRALGDPRKWREQYGNYKYAYLFTIRKGKRGIRKHYCGWAAYCQLAASNIRFLLELVDQAFALHADSSSELSAVPPEIQTKAAQLTGQKNLRELEGLSLQGARLTRFLLGLGRVFQVMSENPVGHTPEVNQFHLSAEISDSARRQTVSELLKEGIMHLALIGYPASKLQELTDVRQLDYTIHPIFAPFFGFSHRRKRKIKLTDEEFARLVDSPREAISDILRGQRRIVDDDLPEQLKLFTEFYATQPRS